MNATRQCGLPCPIQRNGALYVVNIGLCIYEGVGHLNQFLFLHQRAHLAFWITKVAKDTGRKSARSSTAKAGRSAADSKKQQAWDLTVETYEALVEERGEGSKIWGSMIKQTLKRRKPGFSESHYGFRSFSQLLEEAQAREILDLEREEKSGGFIIKGCHTP